MFLSKYNKYVSGLVIILLLCSNTANVLAASNQTQYLENSEDYKKSGKAVNAEGTWHQDDIGWWFEYSGGGYPTNTWEYINNYWYYFNNDGYMLVGWQKIGNHWYYLKVTGEENYPQGSMVTGWLSLGMQYYYLNKSDTNLPEGAMLTGSTVIDGVQYYFNKSGEKSSVRTYEDKAIYTFVDPDASITGGTVQWRLWAALTNDTENTVKVTERDGYCAYNGIGLSIPTYTLWDGLKERNDSHVVDLKWYNQSIMIEPQNTIAFSLENYYNPDNPTHGDITVYPRNNDYMLSFVYSFGYESLATGTVTTDRDGAQVITRRDLRHVTIDYGNLPIKYNNQQGLSYEQLNDAYKLGQFMRNIPKESPIEGRVSFADNVASSSNATLASDSNAQIASDSNAHFIIDDKGDLELLDDVKEEIKINEELVTFLKESYTYFGEDLSDDMARQRVKEKAILLAAAQDYGITVTDLEFKNYKENLCLELALENNEFIQSFFDGFGGEEYYWSSMKENIKNDMMIQKYLDSLNPESESDLDASHEVLINNLSNLYIVK